MSHYIHQNACWRTGVVLGKEENTALIQGDREDRDPRRRQEDCRERRRCHHRPRGRGDPAGEQHREGRVPGELGRRNADPLPPAGPAPRDPALQRRSARGRQVQHHRVGRDGLAEAARHLPRQPPGDRQRGPALHQGHVGTERAGHHHAARRAQYDHGQLPRTQPRGEHQVVSVDACRRVRPVSL